MLDARRVGVQVSLDAAKEPPEVAKLDRDDDTGVLAPGALPASIQQNEVGAIERHDGATVLRRVGKLLFVRNLPGGPASFLAARCIVAATSQGFRQAPEHVFVGVDPDP